MSVFWRVLGCALAAAAVTGAYGYQQKSASIERLETQLAEVEGRYGELQAITRMIEEYRSDTERIEGKRALLDRLRSDRVRTGQLLGRLAAGKPSSVALETIDIQGARVEVTGRAEAPTADSWARSLEHDGILAGVVPAHHDPLPGSFALSGTLGPAAAPPGNGADDPDRDDARSEQPEESAR